MISDADYSTMKCSLVREALSAIFDGEDPGVDVVDVRAHVVGCRDCAAYEERLQPLHAGVFAALPQSPDLVARVVRARVPAWEVLLRLAVAACGGAELLTSLISLTQPGGAADNHGSPHATHESVAFTVALCIGLIVAAVRPRLAASYLPIIGVATLLNVVWSAVDIEDGEISLGHETDHVALILGAVLLLLLAIGTAGRGRGWRLPRWHSRPTPPPPRIRLVMRAVAAFAVIAIPVAVAAPAQAHAVLESSNPAPDQVLAAAPSAVSLHFDEAVTVLPTSVRVFAPNGSRIDDGTVATAPGDGSTIDIGTRNGGDGTYLVSWRVISADSHPVSGAFTYSVGHTSKAPTEAAASTNRTVAVLIGAARWISYAGSSLLIGAGAFVLMGGGRRSRRLAAAGGVVLAVGALGMILLKGPLDAGLGLSALGRGPLLHEVLRTDYGTAAIARGLIGMVAIAVIGRGSRLMQALTLIALAVPLAITFAVSGHAIGSPVAVVVDSAHVLAMSLWLGGLVAVLADGLPHRLEGPIRQFSGVALGSAGLLVATGTYQGWRQVRAWGALTGTTYGRELLIKVGIVLVVIAVAYTSRKATRLGAWSSLRRTVAVEVAGIAVILGISSTLSATQPAYTAWHPDVSANLSILGDTVQVSAVPDGDRSMDLHLYVFNASGELIDPAEVDASVSLPSQQLGPLPVTLTAAGPGHRVGKVSVPVVGEWTLTVTLRTTAIDEDTRTIGFPIH